MRFSLLRKKSSATSSTTGEGREGTHRESSNSINNSSNSLKCITIPPLDAGESSRSSNININNHLDLLRQSSSSEVFIDVSPKTTVVTTAATTEHHHRHHSSDDNHSKVRAIRRHKWEYSSSTSSSSIHSLNVARNAYGAAVVPFSATATTTNTNDVHSRPVRDVILIAGGRGGGGSRKFGNNGGNGGNGIGTPSSVLDSIEIFDPNRDNNNNSNKIDTIEAAAQLCSHRLNVARYSCGALTVTTNVMCLLGGKDPQNDYLDSIELVSDTSATLLSDMYSLPQPMACFGVASISNKVYLFGGKSKNSTLATVYETELSYFVDAYDNIGTETTLNDQHRIAATTTIWKQVGTLTTTATGVAPRHSFSLVVDGNVCWLIGGFDGNNLLSSVGLFHTKKSKYVQHPSSLAVPRSGLTSFALGKSIVVLGGIASAYATNNSTYLGDANDDSHTDYSSPSEAITAELLIRVDGNKDKDKDTFVPVPNLDCPQKDQSIYQIGYKLYAIGQYDFQLKEPVSTIPSMNVFSLRDVFEMEQKIGSIVASTAFPSPTVPKEPAAPIMSPNVEKLKSNMNDWKKQIESTTAEYCSNLQEAAVSSQKIHDQVVGSWMQEIAKTTDTLNSLKPEHVKARDDEVLNARIDTLRIEFEQQKEKLVREANETSQRRNTENQIQTAECKSHIQDIKQLIAEYGTRHQQHQDRLQSDLSSWVDAKKMDISNMEGIVSGTAPAPPMDGRDRVVDLTEDRRKIQLVYSGIDIQPVMVSKEYGRHCTNNYDVKNQIGVGGFGSVYQGNDVTLRCTFAFKRVSMMMADNPNKLQGVLKTFQREVSTLKRVRHPNIVALYGYYMEPGSDDSFLIYELLDRGSLAVFLKSEEGRIRLPYLRRLRIMSESLRALNFLHTGGCDELAIQHRDIKPHNICIAEDWSAKLIDCGLARIERMEDTGKDGSATFFSTENGLVGTDGYICRAYWNGMRPYISKCDIYSFGIVMIELIMGTLNQQNKELPGDFYNHFVASITGVPVLDSVSELIKRCDELVVWDQDDLCKLCNLAIQCLSINVNQRPTAKLLVYEISRMLLRGEIGDLPDEIANDDTGASNSQTSAPCSICNERRDQYIICKNDHTLCSQCITQEAVVASNIGSECVTCPIQECRCSFDIKKDLYAVVPQDVYNKATAEGRIMDCLGRIEKMQNRVVTEISLVRKGVNRGLQAMASLTTSGNSPCPKLVWIIPGESVTRSARNPSTWVRGFTNVPVNVYFLCEHSFTPVSQPVILTVKKKWLSKIAPAMKVTIFVLKLVTTLAGLPFPLPSVGDMSEQVQMAAEFVDSLLDSEHLSLMNRAETLFTDGLLEIDNERMKSLTGRAYDLLADGVRTGGQLTWQDELKPVLNENGATIWVKNDYVTSYTLCRDP